jgi:Tol biopolymer transport system component
MNADGSSVRKLTHAVTPLGDAQPAWSPDGTKIAFVVLRQPPSNEPAAHVMNADGTNVRTASRCAGEGCAESGPSWSPDGRRMAFIRDGEILITSDNKFGLPTLVECSRIAGCVALGEPEWSPDGAQLLFTVERRNSSRQLFSMQLDTGKIKAVLPATIDLCCPSWQPLSSG